MQSLIGVVLFFVVITIAYTLRQLFKSTGKTNHDENY